MEAAALGIFMISACVFGVLMEHPDSPVRAALSEYPVVRRVLMGIAMGLTAIGIIRSPWGRRSGAHMNPAVTLAFLYLGKIAPWDAVFYIAGQFAGGAAGVAIAAAVLGARLRDGAVNYVVTVPGSGGPVVALAAEFAISLLMMATILWVSNSRRLRETTAFFAGGLVAIFIAAEAPLSGMSMNPARTFGSALLAGEWRDAWIYFVAPPAAMLTASLLYRSLRGLHLVFCAKLHHCQNYRCIFHCRQGEINAQ